MLPNDTRIVYDIKKYLIYYATQLNKENIRLKDVLEKNIEEMKALGIGDTLFPERQNDK